VAPKRPSKYSDYDDEEQNIESMPMMKKNVSPLPTKENVTREMASPQPAKRNSPVEENSSSQEDSSSQDEFPVSDDISERSDDSIDPSAENEMSDEGARDDTINMEMYERMHHGASNLPGRKLM